MKLIDLQDGQVVRARWGRAGFSDVKWGPWKDAPLTIQRHKGRITLVTLKDVNWAEYVPEDQVRSEPANLLICEDYYLEIEGLDG